MTYEKKQAFEADSEKIEALQQPGQFPELVATDESLVALYNEQLADGQSLTPLQAEDRAMDDETNWTTLRTFFRRAQRLVGERLTVIVSLVSTVLTDVFGHLHERLDGNDEYGIPPVPFGSTASPAVAETLGTLPAAVRLLRSRKITNGATDTAIPDGCSLARLLCDSSIGALVTSIKDDNEGWTLNRAFNANSYFPNSERIEMNCEQIAVPFEYAGGVVFGADKEYYLNKVKKITPSTAGGYGHGIFNGDVQSHDIHLEGLEEIVRNNGFFGLIRCSGSTTAYHYGLYAPDLKIAPALFSRYNDSSIGITKVVLGKIEVSNYQPYYIYGSAVRTPYLIHFEFGEGTAVSINLGYWSPTMALRTDTDADDYVDLREDTTLSNNLAQFLTNFRSFIALRLTDNGSGKTLTLSQSVYDVIKDENHLFVFDEGTMTIYAYLTNIKNWTVTK